MTPSQLAAFWEFPLETADLTPAIVMSRTEAARDGDRFLMALFLCSKSGEKTRILSSREASLKEITPDFGLLPVMVLFWLQGL